MRLTHSASAWAARFGITALALAAPLGAQNLVANPGFETGTFSGWTQSGNTGNTAVVASSNICGGGPAGHSGAFGTCLGPVASPGYLIQQVIATNPGNVYDISFWLQHVVGTGVPAAYFNAYWDGALLYSNIGGSFTYTNFDFLRPGSASFPDTQLRFEFREDPSYWNLDDVSVMNLGAFAIPEPTSVVLLGTGLVGMAGIVRRRRKAL